MRRIQNKNKTSVWKKGSALLLAVGLMASGSISSLAATAKDSVIDIPLQQIGEGEASKEETTTSKTTSSPLSTPTSDPQSSQLFLTENGEPRAEIYLGEGSNAIDDTALKEMQDTVAMISGATLPRAEALKDEGLQIVLATPDTLPEISTLFADDLAWIGDSDGFAIRQIDNKVYIFGSQSKGMLNGVYDFLEENCGILWTRGVEELGTLYTEQPTLTVTNCDYREKSPFAFRGWNSCGQGATGVHHTDTATRWFDGRTKLNARVGGFKGDIETFVADDGYAYTINGLTPFGAGVTLNVDEYFDEHPDYFITDTKGNPWKNQWSSNLNFYNMEAAEALALELVEYGHKNNIQYVSYSQSDNQHFCMIVDGVDLATQPFTVDGVTVTPDMDNYKSTVYWNFVNHAARKVKELDPDMKIVSLAYIYAECAPAIDIEDNIIIQFAPIQGDDHLPIQTSANNASVKKNLEDWSKLTKNIVVYNYYACLPCEIYSRPIAEKVQKDLQWYAELGLKGVTPEGGVDSAPGYPNYNAWSMNHLYYWLMNELFWNPYADLDALTVKFCDAAYGKGSAYMQEYYRLIQQGWDMYDDMVWYISGGDTYIKKFIIDAGVADQVIAALDNAYNAAEGEVEKKRIDLIRQTVIEQIDKWANYEAEEGYAYYSDLGKEVLTAEENLSVTEGPWSEITPLTVFKGQELEDCFRDVEVRLMWDTENVYVAYKIPNEKIGTEENPYDKISPISEFDSWFKNSPEFNETYLCGNMTNLNDHHAFYSDAKDQTLLYDAGATFHARPYEWESHSRQIADGDPSERYWMNVLVIPFETLGVNYQSAVLGGTFISNISDQSYSDSIYYGWCGANVWSTSSFRLIEMVGGPDESEDADKDELQNLYDLNKDKVNDGYTDGSWAAFQKALADAKSVLDDADATQEAVDSAADKLAAAVSGLTKATTPAADVDKTKLQRLYNSIKDQSNEGFTAASWQTFEDARDNAKAVLEQADATQKAVDDAYTRLMKALVQLKKIDNTTAQESYLIIALSHEGGSISPSGKVHVVSGSDKTFTVTADSGYHIQKVLVDGKQVQLEDGKYTFKDIEAGHTIEAFFTKEKSNVNTGAVASDRMMPALCGIALLSAAVLLKAKRR